MKSHEPQDMPQRPWYKKLWFLALINGFGSILGFWYLSLIVVNNPLSVLNPTPIGSPIMIVSGGIIGLINATIFAYTVWHDDIKPPHDLIAFISVIWSLAFALMSVICVGFMFAFLGIAMILGALGTWTRIGGWLLGIIVGSINIFTASLLISVILSVLGIDLNELTMFVIVAFSWGSIYGLTFADVIQRDNRRNRRAIQFAQGYSPDFSNNLTVGDDGELVEIDEKETQPDKKQNS